MSKEALKTRQLFDQLFGDRYEILDGIVEGVNEDDHTVDVRIDEDVVLYEIKLRSVVGGDNAGLVCVPKNGSEVVFAMIRGESDFVLLKTSALDKVIVEVGVKVEIKSPLTLFNGGNNGGLVVVGSCVDKLNAIEQDVNDLKELLQTALGTTVTEQGNGAPSALQIALNEALNNWYGKKIKETKVDDIENKNVKH